HLAALAFCLDGGIELPEEANLALLAEAHDVADREPLRGLDESQPARAVETAMQGRLHRRLGPATDATSAKARRDHAGVIDDERVARAQQFGQIAHGAVIELALRA